jgi:hypothetical protein
MDVNNTAMPFCHASGPIVRIPSQETSWPMEETTKSTRELGRGVNTQGANRPL